MNTKKMNFALSVVALLFSSTSFAQFGGLTYPVAGYEYGSGKLFKDASYKNEMAIPYSLHTDGVGVPYISDQYNDSLSSIQIGSDECYFLFEHKDYQGGAYGAWQNFENLKSIGFNDIVSSYFVTRKPAPTSGIYPPPQTSCADSVSWLYEHPYGNNTALQPYGDGFAYPLKVVATGVSRIIKLPSYNDKVSSVKVRRGECLKLWVNSPPSSSDVTSYNNWYLNPSAVIKGSQFDQYGKIENLPNGIADEVSVVELVRCP